MPNCNTIGQNFLIFRPQVSGYFSQDFVARERTLFKGLPYTNSWNEVLSGQGPIVLITNTNISPDFFGQWQGPLLERLKLVIHPNSGYDNLPVQWVQRCQQANIPIVLGNSIRAQAVAQYIVQALFLRLSELPLKTIWDKSRQWPRLLLEQVSVQIIGLGHIGQIVQRTLSSLGAQLFVYDPYLQQHQLHWEQSDIIIFSCGLNPSSREMLNAQTLAKLKPHAHIINAARGELIEQQALISFLQNHPKAYATLDVFQQEPCDLQSFSQLKNISTTCHIAGVYLDIEERLLQFEKNVFNDFLQKDRPGFFYDYRQALLQNKIFNSELI